MKNIDTNLHYTLQKKLTVMIINMSNHLTGDMVSLNLKPYVLITVFSKIEHKLLERHIFKLSPANEDRMVSGSGLLTGCHLKMNTCCSY